MAMKGYSTLPRSLEQKPHHHMQFNVILKRGAHDVMITVIRNGRGERSQLHFT